MIEILFRGKRVDNGEWVEGFYAVIGVRHTIIVKQSEDYYTSDGERHGNEVIEVISKTVGQYTGLKDKNGRKIFEGDIVCVYSHPDEVGDDDFAVIRYDNDDAMFIIEFDTFCLNFGSCRGTDVEVIGNIYDNPELLEEL